ncbi:phytanoyl-CoA dioxygenase family protein [bacterium]|nr:phytanoyl-CoA dioxygenase family protein [bacterium]
MAELIVLPANASREEVLEVVARDGGVIVRDLLRQDTVNQFKSDIEVAARDHPTGATTGNERTVEFWGGSTKRFTRLGWRSRTFEDILLAPMLIGMADEVLLPSCDDYWLNTGQMMIIGPGESEQMWHRDAGNWMMLCTPTSPEVTISCMYALGGFTAANGATRVVPGSHLWDDYTQAPTADQVAIAEMNAGDGLIYSGRVIHNGGANTTTSDWRLGLHVSFVLGWLTPEEALPLATPWSAASAMSERAQRLLGWKSYGERSRLWTVDYEEISVALKDPSGAQGDNRLGSSA